MLLAAFSQYFFGISIFLSSIFLIMLVLVQRGRGGGLTGALGGPGGQSAFGTKAGDLFTRITIGVAVVWIVLCALSVFFLKPRGLPSFGPDGTTSTNISSSLGGDDESSSNVVGPPPTDLLGDTTGSPEAESTSATDAGDDSESSNEGTGSGDEDPAPPEGENSEADSGDESAASGDDN
ncbi:MAG: preprotein translocase subunit SecG [Aureliella sp.]